MGKFKHGSSGPFSGKIGNIIGSSWRGITYMKSVSKKSKKERSPKQLKNEEEFKIAHHWLSPLLDFVREGFRHPSKSTRGFIAAKSHLLNNALVRKGRDSYIIPSQMLISSGTLPLPADLSMAFNASTCKIDISWNPKKTETPDEKRSASYNDQVMYVAYNVAESEVVGEVFGPTRAFGQCEVELQPGLKGTYHVYVAFHSVDRKNQTDSIYMGEVEVA